MVVVLLFSFFFYITIAMKVRLANLNQIRYIIMAISTSGEEKKERFAMASLSVVRVQVEQSASTLSFCRRYCVKGERSLENQRGSPVDIPPNYWVRCLSKTPGTSFRCGCYRESWQATVNMTKKIRRLSR